MPKPIFWRLFENYSSNFMNSAPAHPWTCSIYKANKGNRAKIHKAKKWLNNNVTRIARKFHLEAT